MPDYTTLRLAEDAFARGVARHAESQLAQAIAAYEEAIALDPDHSTAYDHRGIALTQAGDPAAALASHDRALAIDPDNPDTLVNRGIALARLGETDAAVAAFDAAATLEPGHIKARINKAVTLADAMRLRDAIIAFGEAIALAPDEAALHFHQGVALMQCEAAPAAIEAFDHALKLQPDAVEILCNKGFALDMAGDTTAALAVFEKVERLAPGVPYVADMRLALKRILCDWRGDAADLAAVTGLVDRGVAGAAPWTLASVSDDPAVQRRAADIYIADRLPPPAPPLPAHPRRARIRIGYFAAEFQQHATMQLFGEVLEAHDKGRFETFAFSYGPPSDDDWRRRAVAAVDHFIDIAAMPDAAVAALARRHGIDIAVDLKGFTRSARSGIFAARAAPVQVNYLGFPGTMGSGLTDYIIADARLIPPGEEVYFGEAVVRLAGSYQPNAAALPVELRRPARAAAGLPEGVVFCCFNQSYKITAAVFDRWMEILRGVDGSVLWLFVTNPVAQANLRREAEARGIAADRLIFADPLPVAAHLARLPLADLFLDTAPYGAHTTASDALRMGVPLITAPGRSFASRVAASLLHSLGMTELVAASPADYVAQSVTLGRDPARLAAVRARLGLAITGAALLKPLRYVRELEAAFAAMYERSQSGQPPAAINL